MRTKRFSLLLCGLLAGLFGFETAVRAATPNLSLILPRGVQRGTEVTLDLRGRRIGDCEEVLFHKEGFEVKNIEMKDANRVLVTVAIAADCPLGEHPVQLRCKTGVSEYRSFFVSNLPIVDEKEPNTEFDAPQVVDLNVTVHGIVDREDVDYYRVTAKKGQRLSAEVEAMRLGTRLFDPYIAILDAKRFEVASSDDLPLLHQDGACSIVVPEDGEYTVMIREAAYGGDGSSRYRLHIGTFPRPTAVYPAGGKVGEETTVKFIGDPKGDFETTLKLPAETKPEYGLLPQDPEGVAPSENPFRLFEHGNDLEVEPNNVRTEATPATLPNAMNGIIGEPGDQDYFKFTAKKNQQFEVECYARRLRSPLDPVMYIYRQRDGRQLASSDDSRGPDSYFRFKAPEDGEYVVRVRDHLMRGGADFVYRIEFQTYTPDLEFNIPRISRYGQERQQIVIPRGGRFATLINAKRTNFSGDLVLEPKSLPEGVTMTADTMLGNMTSMPVLFEAKADAPIEGDLYALEGRHADASKNITGHFRNYADFIRGQNNVILWGLAVDEVPIAVVEEAPFSIELIEPKVPIVQNGSMNLKVVVTRKEGFDKAIRLQFPFRPPGIGTNSSVTIPAGKNEGIYPLNANSKAAIGDWKVFVLASADVNGELCVSSKLTKLTIAQPYVSLALDRVAVEQGQETDMLVKMKTLTPFEGEASIALKGLPHKVVAEPMRATKDAEEFIFHLTTDPKSPAGRHKNIFAEVIVTMNGEPIPHRVGSTEVRVDKPLPKPKPKVEPKKETKKAEPKPKPKPQAKPAKPLSRLEKLRLEAQKRRDEGSR